MKMKKRIVCIIPARLGSYRFPTKPFVDICGKSMIEHVYKRAELCKSIDQVYVATPNIEIKNHVEKFGGMVIMTSDDVRRASDRVAQAAKKIDKADIIINLQGDEPLVTPEMIDDALKPIIEDPTISCVSLAKKVAYNEAKDIHEVKVVYDNEMNALYFSRAAIPYDANVFFEHIGIYVYKRNALDRFVSMDPSILETTEKLEQLRALGASMKINLLLVHDKIISIDTIDDVERLSNISDN